MMQISMMPHSGVVAFDFLDHPFPVVGWVTYEPASGGVMVIALVLEEGRLVHLNDEKVRYAVLGTNHPYWREVIQAHNAFGDARNVRLPQ